MTKFSHFNKITSKADLTVGFCRVEFNNAKAFSLEDGEDDAGDPVPVGVGGATGAIIVLELSASQTARVNSNGSEPSFGSKRGIVLDKDKTTIYIGRTAEHQGDVQELVNFRIIGSSATMNYLHVTYVRYP